MPDDSTNPARRLYRLLSRARLVSDEKKAREVLAPVFGVKPEDSVALRRGLLLIDDLFQATVDQVSALEGVDHGRFLRHIPRMRGGLANLNLDSLAKGPLLTALDPVALENLDLCAARLGEAVKEAELTADDLRTLEKELSELFDYVETADIDNELRLVALDLIQTLRQSLLEYRIRGADGLRAALEESVGKLTLYYLRSKGEVDPKPVNRIWRVIVTVEGLVARALTYGPYLPDSIIKMLGPGS